MAINIEWQVKPPSKVRRTSERTQYEKAPKNPGTCIGLRRYLHEATQVSALKPHSFKGQRDRYDRDRGQVLRPQYLCCKNTQFLSYKLQNHQKIIQYSDNLKITNTIPHYFGCKTK